MNGRKQVFSLVVRRDDKVIQSVSIENGTTRIGRGRSNQVNLPDPKVSRKHVEITCTGHEVVMNCVMIGGLVDVNGVLRPTARLQAGDHFKVGPFDLELGALPLGGASSTLVQTADSAVELGKTVDEPIHLPQQPAERRLATLLHLCYVAEDEIADDLFERRTLKLLLVAFGASEIHLFSDQLIPRVCETAASCTPHLKQAAAAAKRGQVKKEATAISGADIGRPGQALTEYHYLVGSLCTGPGPSPMLVLLKSAEWNPFSVEDRTLLQAVCYLWVRGRGRWHEFRELRREKARLDRARSRPVVIESRSPVVQQLMKDAQRAAQTNTPVLILGETGTGKEVLADLIHHWSPRNAGPFVPCNCAALPESLIESELFGHARGAFTGAVAERDGKLQQAHGGTLFLDEIGDMAISAQAKVLRALETGELQRLGDTGITRADVRFVAATHHDLRRLVAEKLFREDLFYRVAVHVLPLPPLRERQCDIDDLAVHFLKMICEENALSARRFSPEALDSLRKHRWPGNVRELRGIVEVCATLGDGREVSADEVCRALDRFPRGMPE